MVSMRSFLKQFVAGLARRAASSRLTALLPLFADGRANMLRVLTYHRVDHPESRVDLSPATLSATPEGFACQMACLREHFHVTDLNEVCEAYAGKRILPPWSVLITFDDAYHDFRDHAWPVLRRLGLAATVFVPTAYAADPQRSFWWDQLHWAIAQSSHLLSIETCVGQLDTRTESERRSAAAKLIHHLERIPHTEALAEVGRIEGKIGGKPPAPTVLGWNDLRQLASEGVSLAPHTRTHPLLNRISLDAARLEVRASRDELVAAVGCSPPAFAYPGGAFDDAVVRMLAEEGFEVAFTTCRGSNECGHSSPLKLRRFNVGMRTSVELLRAQLLLPAGCVNACYPLRSVA